MLKMFISSFVALAALATSVSAISFSTPAKGENVDLNAGYTVSWTTVASDLSSAYLILVNDAPGQSNSTQVIAMIDSATGSFKVTLPDLPVGSNYHFDFRTGDTVNSNLLAQSPQFNVIDTSGSPSSSTAAVLKRAMNVPGGRHMARQAIAGDLPIPVDATVTSKSGSFEVGGAATVAADGGGVVVGGAATVAAGGGGLAAGATATATADAGANAGALTSFVTVGGGVLTLTEVATAVTTVGNCSCTETTSASLVQITSPSNGNGTVTVGAAVAVDAGRAKAMAVGLFAAAIWAGLLA